MLKLLVLSILASVTFAESLTIDPQGLDLVVSFDGAVNTDPQPGEWQGINVCADDFNGTLIINKRTSNHYDRVLLYRGLKRQYTLIPINGFVLDYWEVNDKKMNTKTTVEFDPRGPLNIVAIMKKA